MNATTILQHVLVVLMIYVAGKMTPRYVIAMSDLDNVRHMFPGLYDNKLQYDHDKALNISEQQIHQWLTLNISIWKGHETNTSVLFHFRATDPHVKTFNVEKIFSVESFNFQNQLLFSVYYRVIGESRAITAVQDLRDTNKCDMLWKRTVYGSYRNVEMIPCPVDGIDDKYTVNTTMELSESYLNVVEIWLALQRQIILPGPRTAFHFIKQHKHKNTGG